MSVISSVWASTLNCIASTWVWFDAPVPILSTLVLTAATSKSAISTSFDTMLAIFVLISAVRSTISSVWPAINVSAVSKLVTTISNCNCVATLSVVFALTSVFVVFIWVN